jgi:putative ABC transport system substrate-binding protein
MSLTSILGRGIVPVFHWGVTLFRARIGCMKRRDFITLLGGAAAMLPLAGQGQQARMPVIGFIDNTSADGRASYIATFRQGLKEAGFVEGQNIGIEFRWAEGQNDRLPEFAAELVRLPVAVIVTNTNGIIPAKAATTTIPIVFVTGGDPVRSGFVASLNRPGGNVTGISQLNSTLGSKRLELLQELIPKATTIAFLINPSNATHSEIDLPDMQAAAKVLGLQLIILRATNKQEIDAAFAALAQQRHDGLIVAPDPYFTSQRAQILPLVARQPAPAIYSPRDWVVAGGLMSYGTNTGDAYRQAGVYTGRILKGAKPADLPIVQPTKYEMVINLKTAKTLDLKIPDKVLALADEVIE